MAQVSYGTITITDTTDIESIKNWYLATNASSGVTKTTSGWTDTIQQMTASKQYLWNYEQILGANNTEISSTLPVIIGHYGINGQNGADGNSITSIDEYYQATNSTTNPGSSGWQNTLVAPTSTNKYLWNYQVINYSKTAAEGDYNDARIIGVYGDTGPQGNPGTNGINTATVYLYQRATSAPTKPSGSLTYTFSSARITSGTLGNWKQSIGELTGTDPIWVIAAIASSNGTTDTIDSSEWSVQIKLAQNGTDGQPGSQGAAGLNQATIFIYKRGDSVTKPNNSTYTFSTGEFTLSDNTWSKTIPSTPTGKPCWVSSAVAIGNETTATLVWNTPSVLVEDGTNGISPTVTSTSNGVKIVDAEGNETYITNGTNGTSYYTFVRYSENANGSGYVSTPTSATKYIGVYSGTNSSPPAYNDSGWTWSKYVGDNGISITQTRELYYLKTNSTTVPTITASGQITATDRQNGWTSIVPTYVVNGEYWICIETSLSSGGPVWSTPVLNKALTDESYSAYLALSISQSANENANGALSIATGVEQHFFWIGEDYSTSVPAGAYMAERGKDEFKANPTGGNLITRTDGIYIRNGANLLSSLTGSALNFYQPPTISGNTVTQGKKTMMLSANALTFYDPTNGTTEQAKLDANGLILSKGGVKAGTAGQSGFIYLSTEPYGSYSINGSSGISDWKEIIGTKFGVRADGTLYANNAVISGTITVGSGSTIDSGATIGGTSASTVVNNAATGAQASSDLSDFQTTVANTYATQSELSNVEGQIPSDINELSDTDGIIPNDLSQLTDTTNIISGAVSTGVAGKADKIEAVYRTQRIYYRKTSSGAPDENTTWLTSSGTGYGNWSLKIPQLTSGSTKYPYLYTAVQTQTISQYNSSATTNNCTCSTVLLDDSTTVIDGGTIITGSIAANRLDVYDASINKISASAIDVASIQIGQSQVNNLTTELGNKANSSDSNWLVMITTTGIPDYVTPSVTLKATFYHGGTKVTSGFGTPVWTKNGTTTLSGATFSNGESTITVTDIDAFYTCTISSN